MHYVISTSLVRRGKKPPSCCLSLSHSPTPEIVVHHTPAQGPGLFPSLDSATVDCYANSIGMYNIIQFLDHGFFKTTFICFLKPLFSAPCCRILHGQDPLVDHNAKNIDGALVVFGTHNNNLRHLIILCFLFRSHHLSPSPQPLPLLLSFRGP
jgi:hypothetical protein